MLCERDCDSGRLGSDIQTELEEPPEHAERTDDEEYVGEEEPSSKGDAVTVEIDGAGERVADTGTSARRLGNRSAGNAVPSSRSEFHRRTAHATADASIVMTTNTIANQWFNRTPGNICSSVVRMTANPKMPTIDQERRVRVHSGTASPRDPPAWQVVPTREVPS